MKINIERVKNDIKNLSDFTSTTNNGVTRLAFTKTIKDARGYILKEMEIAGLKTWEDGYSTIFGRKEGEDAKAPIIMIGSHYDSVINGGMFDGVAGVVASLEVARVLTENNIKHINPIEVVAMNDEEGVRFGSGLANSRAMSGLIDENDLINLVDSNNISFMDAIANYGLNLDLENAKRKPESIKNFIELHIEQGPVLEKNNTSIGIVENIAGLNRYTVKFNGKSGHAGTTPMNMRRDALIAASHFIIAVENIAKALSFNTVATVGKLDLVPNSQNVIPKKVELSVDIRSDQSANFKEVERALIDKIGEIQEKTGIIIELYEDSLIYPVEMCRETIKKIESIANELSINYMKLNSGAAHDAMVMANITKSNMIFIPSKDGLSHNPDEWTDYEDFKIGIELLLNLVIRLSN